MDNNKKKSHLPRCKQGKYKKLSMDLKIQDIVKACKYCIDHNIIID